HGGTAAAKCRVAVELSDLAWEFFRRPLRLFAYKKALSLVMTGRSCSGADQAKFLSKWIRIIRFGANCRKIMVYFMVKGSTKFGAFYYTRKRYALPGVSPVYTHGQQWDLEIFCSRI
ncbi:MAG: hypothetical protein NC246_16550, partial [Muribaculaceae bacterium]|nr:hypothetical protein [Muribaculaceae bacterium]